MAMNCKITGLECNGCTKCLDTPHTYNDETMKPIDFDMMGEDLCIYCIYYEEKEENGYCNEYNCHEAYETYLEEFNEILCKL